MKQIKKSNNFSAKMNTNRDVKGRFVSGGGGLRVPKKFKWRRVLPVIVAVSLMGGFLVYQSYANSNYGNCQHFDHRCLTESEQSTAVRMYYSVLGRAPNNNEVRYWTGRLNGSNGKKLTTTQVANYFINSQEFKRLHSDVAAALSAPSPAGNELFIQTIYKQIHGKPADASIVRLFAAQITNRKLTPAAFVAGAVNNVDTKKALLNKVAVALGVKEKTLCLSRNGSNLDVADTQRSPYRNVELPSNTVINAASASWDGKTPDGTPITWATIIDGGSGSCWYGGRYFGTWNDRSPDVTWENPYHHSAGMVIRSSNFLVEGLRVHNQGDGISMEKGGSNFHIRNVYLSDIHDDCVQNDWFNSGVTEGSLFDGCYAGFSAASQNGSGAANTWRIENNLLRMKPFHTIYKPEKYLARGCKIPSHTTLFKGWTEKNPGPKVILKNNIFRADEDSCIGTLSIPPKMALKECSNNTIVWLGKGKFPYILPDCIKVTTDKKVWDVAVANWKKAHPSVGW